MKRNKTITEKDLFYFYPYKKNMPVVGKTIPQPYIKKKDESNHRFSLTYDIWLSVLEDYIDEISNILLRGKIIKLPLFLGELQLKKYKLNRKIDWGESRKANKKIYMNPHELYAIIVKWNRHHKVCKFKNYYHWKISMNSGLGRKIFEAHQKDPNYQYTIRDV